MLQYSHLNITYIKDGRTGVRDFTITFNPGDKTALSGEEGNGKSTLLKWMADPSLIRHYAHAEGVRVNRGEKTGYLPQELPEEDREKTVYEYLCEEPFFAEDPAGVHETAALTGMDPASLYSDQKMKTLSGGERIRIQIARLIIGKASALFLDEPSNDLDIDALVWLTGFIRSFKGIVVFISHDETLLEETADRIIHMEMLKRKTESRITVAGCGYREYIRRREDLFARQTQLAQNERKQEAIRMEKFRKIQNSVDHALNTVSRQDPHSGRLLKKKMKSVKSMEKRFDRERENMTEMPVQEEAILFRFDDACHIPAGKRILEMDLKELKTPEGKCLSENIHLDINGAGHVCVIGKNGCGKTTLLRRIYEILKDRSDIRVVYMPQNYEEELDMDMDPVTFLAEGKEKEAITEARAYLGAMRYTTDEMEHSMQELSGGQKAKVLMLKMNLAKANVLILDEPTRNFSPLSGPVIRSTLKEFRGCIISVSHDRQYIREVCDTLYRMDEKGLHRLQSV